MPQLYLIPDDGNTGEHYLIDAAPDYYMIYYFKKCWTLIANSSGKLEYQKSLISPGKIELPLVLFLTHSDFEIRSLVKKLLD